MREWFRITAKGEDKSEAELYIYGDIGRDWWGDGSSVSAKDFITALKALPDTVMKASLRVNSLGGDVFDAAAIATSLRSWARAKEGRTIDASVDGIAASAASVVIMAGDTIRIGDNAMVMVHNPWTWGYGNAADMRKLAAELDKVRDSIVAAYKWHSKLTDAELVALMDAETWMSADEAIANGFATEKVEGLKAAASLNRRVNPKLAIPERFKAQVTALLEPEPTQSVAASAGDVLRLCTDAGLDLAFANGLLGAKMTVDQVTARVNAEKGARATAAARAEGITALLANAKMPQFAAMFIKSSLSLDEVRTSVVDMRALRDNVEIDGGLGAGNPANRTTAPIDLSAVYAARNATATGTSTAKEK
jgi:ATP-dependent protease ClpP protease subunit